MIARFGKRTVAFLLAMIMVFSLVPVPAFAEETGEHEHNHDSEIAADVTVPSTEAAVAVIHEHDYVSAVTAQPTCVEKGAVTYTCECGDECKCAEEAAAEETVTEEAVAEEPAPEEAPVEEIIIEENEPVADEEDFAE